MVFGFQPCNAFGWKHDGACHADLTSRLLRRIIQAVTMQWRINKTSFIRALCAIFRTHGAGRLSRI